MKRNLLVIPTVVGAVLGSGSSIQAQSYHLPAAPEKGFVLEASHANLESVDQSFPSTLWFLSGRLPVGQGFRIVADVPFAYSRVNFPGGAKESNSVLGNPLVGAEYGVRGWRFETGIRLPLNTIDDESFADAMGVLGDFQRGEAFMNDVVPVAGAVAYEYGLPRGATLQGRAGVVGLFDTSHDSLSVDNEALLDYGLLGTYPLGRARLGLGFYGRWAATEDTGDFNDNSIHHLALSGDFMFRRVRPGISVRIPVDETYNDLLNSTIGFYVQMSLR